MRTVTRTIYGSSLQTAMHTGLPHEIPPHSSVAEALTDPLAIAHQPTPITAGMEVFADYDANADTKDLAMRYIVIGNGAHYNVTGPVGGPPYPDTKKHRARDSGLYRMMPFLVRPATNDLTISQRQKYRLRKTLYIDGILYVAYYARVLDLTSVTPEETLTTIVDGNPIISNFVPTINDRRPTPPDIGTTNDGSFLAVSANITITLSAAEVQDIRDACALIFGDENQAIISEIGHCTGLDRVVTAVYPNDIGAPQVPVAVAPDTYYDVVGLQIATHVTTVIPLIYSSGGVEMTYDIGNTEPLYGTDID